MKTLQECKDEVAEKNGWKSFNAYYQQGNKLDVLAMMDEAAELYARAKWDEACEAQRQICWSQLELQANQNKVLKAPLAVFDAW